MKNNIYELISYNDLIETLKPFNKKIELSFTEVLFDNGFTDYMMNIEEVIKHLKTFDQKTLVMVKKICWDVKSILSLEITKIQDRVACKNIRYPEDNIEDIPYLHLD